MGGVYLLNLISYWLYRFVLDFLPALTQNNKDKADIALDDTETNKNNLYGKYLECVFHGTCSMEPSSKWNLSKFVLNRMDLHHRLYYTKTYLINIFLVQN